MTLGVKLMEDFEQGSPDHERYKEITAIIQDAKARFQLFDCGTRAGVGLAFDINGVQHRMGLRIPDATLEKLRLFIGEGLDN